MSITESQGVSTATEGNNTSQTTNTDLLRRFAEPWRQVFGIVVVQLNNGPTRDHDDIGGPNQPTSVVWVRGWNKAPKTRTSGPACSPA